MMYLCWWRTNGTSWYHSWWLATEVMLEIYIAAIEAWEGWLRKNGGSQGRLCDDGGGWRLIGGWRLMEIRQRFTLQQKLDFFSILFLFSSFSLLLYFYYDFHSPIRRFYFFLAFCSSLTEFNHLAKEVPS